jgi:glycosyltransferase involved in cell wall biosynthesis
MESGLKPLVSVIIRTKDRPLLLSEALKSVASQTYPNMEIVLVNDGGADVKDLAERIAGHIPLVYVCHETNLGRSAAANSGLMAATGQYLNFLDDDDVFYPDHIETLLAALEAVDGRVAYSSVLTVYYAGSPENPGQRIREEVVFNRKFESDRLLFENYIPLMSVLFSRSVLEKVPSFDENMELFEDWDFWMRISRFIEFLYVDKITAEYRFFGYQQAEDAHRQKYAYDQALGVMFEKALPYLSGRAWLHFLNEGLVGSLRLLQQQKEDQLREIETMYIELRDEYHACLTRSDELSSQMKSVQREYDVLAGEMAAMRRSISWRMTAPLRYAKKIAVSAGHLFANPLSHTKNPINRS